MTAHDFVLVGAIGTISFMPVSNGVKLAASVVLLIAGLLGFSLPR